MDLEIIKNVLSHFDYFIVENCQVYKIKIENNNFNFINIQNDKIEFMFNDLDLESCTFNEHSITIGNYEFTVLKIGNV